jgi:alpha-glucuronidase
MKRIFLYTALLICCSLHAVAEDGYRLWLRYDKVSNKALYDQYRLTAKQLVFPGTSPTLAAAREELGNGLKGLLDLEPLKNETVTTGGALVVGTPASSKIIASNLVIKAALKTTGNEGYAILTVMLNGKPATVIAANTDNCMVYLIF